MNQVSAAKTFKEYDRKYSRLAGKGRMRIIQRLAGERIEAITHWKYRSHLQVYGVVEVKYAVYDSDTADMWQQFRVSLKGLTTKEKLFLLEERWNDMLELHSELERKLERCRIDNYIGALKRGGQLNDKLEVVR